MQTLKGKYNHAKVFTSNIDNETYSQVIQLLNQEFTKDSRIRIMPDCHAGAGCVIGTTMTIHDRVVPNLVGVDIGCGMLTYNLGPQALNLEQLDNFIYKNIPAGMNVHRDAQVLELDITKIKCFKELGNHKYYYQSVGTLGGGNHFIEICVDDEMNNYLIIHSGSRNLGNRIAEYYQQKAIRYIQNKVFNIEEESQKIIKEYKKSGLEKELSKNLKKLKKKKVDLPIPKELCYLEGQDMQDYLYDMHIAQQYASINRYSIAKRILSFLGLDPHETLEVFETIHNYINMEDMILRKGAISAYENEQVLIPINMRDGCIIGVGKGNPDYNYSAPHGAGRLLSRREAQRLINLDHYIHSMKGIYTTSVNHHTIDEAPFVYKPIDEILNNITETVEVQKIIKPIYNFKSK